MKPMLILSVILLTPVAACVSTPPHKQLMEPSPVFSPQTFFSGKTVGEGKLDIALQGNRQTHVEGRGHVESDGTLVLVQTVAEEGQPPYTRTWRLQPIDETHFTGSLTDADGPISAEVSGNLLHIRYRARKGGLDTEQWLYLQPGGQIALNRLVARKFGFPVATLNETITRKH